MRSLVFKTKKGNIVNLNSLPGFNMDNMVSETIANMLPYVAKFDPKQNYNYLNHDFGQLLGITPPIPKLLIQHFYDLLF